MFHNSFLYTVNLKAIQSILLVRYFNKAFYSILFFSK